MTHYSSWRAVPSHLMTASRLSELEFPRTPGKPVATVDAANWRGKQETFTLFDALRSAPTRTSAARLEQLNAAKGLKLRTCQDCGAHCQVPLAPDEPLCVACRHVAAIRKAQAIYGRRRELAAVDIAGWLATDGAAVVQVDATIPPPTGSGRRRPATAVRVRAVDAGTGKQALDVLVRTVGPRAQFVPADAVDPAVAVPKVHKALLGRLLLFWDGAEATLLREAAPHEEWKWPTRPPWRFVVDLSRVWRGEIDPHGPVTSTSHSLIGNIPPGSPDRLLLHLTRIARTARPQR